MSFIHLHKTLLYLLCFSMALHAAVFAGLDRQQRPPQPTTSIVLELEDLPTSDKHLPNRRSQAPSQHEHATHSSLNGSKPAGSEKSVSAVIAGNSPSESTTSSLAPLPRPSATLGVLQAEGGGEQLITRKEHQAPRSASLFPTHDMVAGLEEEYRRKYQTDTNGERFFDETDDVIGPYSRRFLQAVRGRWQLVGRRLLAGRQYGYGLLSIGINRDGTIADVDVVESSGNRRVDMEIIETVRTAGFVGPLPKSWRHERLQGYYAYSAGYEATL